MRRLGVALFAAGAVSGLALTANSALAERDNMHLLPVKTNFAHGAYDYKEDPKYNKQEVSYSTGESPGTIVIETRKRFLYLVLGEGKALRYGIGVGRYGFGWQGTEHVTRKAEWPDWHPPKEMLERDPDLPESMEGGPNNPLGAR